MMTGIGTMTGPTGKPPPIVCEGGRPPAGTSHTWRLDQKNGYENNLSIWLYYHTVHQYRMRCGGRRPAPSRRSGRACGPRPSTGSGPSSIVELRPRLVETVSGFICRETAA